MAKKSDKENSLDSADLENIDIDPKKDIFGNSGEKKSKKKKSKPRGKITVLKEPTKGYSMLDDIKESWLYRKKALGSKDGAARKYIDNNAEKVKPNQVQPGQLILFKYLNPKGKEELEYYDASPCTIFFGIFNTEDGERLLGFNIHYYPPKMRYRIMDKIFELYRPVYLKYFSQANEGLVDAFDYKFLVNELEKANLAFGVRMYIPSKMSVPRVIPTNMWKVAVFTEGWFKKKTRGQILGFWRQWKEKKAK